MRKAARRIVGRTLFFATFVALALASPARAQVTYVWHGTLTLLDEANNQISGGTVQGFLTLPSPLLPNQKVTLAAVGASFYFYDTDLGLTWNSSSGSSILPTDFVQTDNFGNIIVTTFSPTAPDGSILTLDDYPVPTALCVNTGITDRKNNVTYFVFGDPQEECYAGLTETYHTGYWTKELILFHPHRIGFLQTIRVTVAGPTNVPPGVPVEAVLGFRDANGNPSGPSKLVTLTPGQTESLDFSAPANAEVLPVVTPPPGSIGFFGEIRASTEVFDDVLGIGTAFEAGHASLPSAPVFAPQGLAGGQTMRVTVFSRPPQPCIATLGFEDSMGNPVGTTLPVNLSGGQSASLDLDSETLNLRLGQRTEIQPIVTLGTPAATAAESEMSACPASVEVFNHTAGRTATFQPGEVSPGPVNIPGLATPVAAQ